MGSETSFRGVESVSASGVPLENNRTAEDYHCGWSPRSGSLVGGGKGRKGRKGRKTLKQRGGCNCQRGGGGGSGGYGFTLNNDIGKVYAATTAGPCPVHKGGSYPWAASYNFQANQKGGNYPWSPYAPGILPSANFEQKGGSYPWNPYPAGVYPAAEFPERYSYSVNASSVHTPSATFAVVAPNKGCMTGGRRSRKGSRKSRSKKLRRHSRRR